MLNTRITVGIYEFTGDTPVINEGDLLTSLDDPPYLIRVDAPPEIIGNTMKITFSPASVGNVIINGSIEANLHYGTGNSGDCYRQGAGDINYEPPVSFDPIDIDLDQEIFNSAWGPGVFYNIDSPINLTLSFQDDSHVVLTSDVKIKFEASLNGDIAMTAGLYDTNLDMAAIVLAEFDASYNSDEQINIPLPISIPSVELGPVMCTVGIQLYAGYDLNVACHGEATLGYYFRQTGFKIGGRLESNIWNPGSTELIPELDFGTPEAGVWPEGSDGFSAFMECDGDITAYVRPWLGAEFIGGQFLGIDLPDAWLLRLSFKLPSCTSGQ
jgi:hypothetical protein